MSYKEQVTEAIKTAMRERNALARTTLRGVMAAIKQIEVDERKELNNDEVLKVLQKQVKSRNESIVDAEKADRQDIIDEANEEIAILSVFLPKGLSTEELTVLVKEAIAESDANSPADMGSVMKAVMPKVAGRAEGSVISQLVIKLLKG
jgi:uncharacterized protein